MPYRISKKDGKYCVEKKDGSKTFGCHSKVQDAKNQLAAIHASENRKKRHA